MIQNWRKILEENLYRIKVLGNVQAFNLQPSKKRIAWQILFKDCLLQRKLCFKNSS